jgi:hypothetical protein
VQADRVPTDVETSAVLRASENYGSARLRVFTLPNGQFFVIMDMAGFVWGDERSAREWIELRETLLARLGPECAGVLRYAGELQLPEDQDVQVGDHT